MWALVKRKGQLCACRLFSHLHCLVLWRLAVNLLRLSGRRGAAGDVSSMIKQGSAILVWRITGICACATRLLRLGQNHTTQSTGLFAAIFVVLPSRPCMNRSYSKAYHLVFGMISWPVWLWHTTRLLAFFVLNVRGCSANECHPMSVGMCCDAQSGDCGGGHFYTCWTLTGRRPPSHSQTVHVIQRQLISGSLPTITEPFPASHNSSPRSRATH